MAFDILESCGEQDPAVECTCIVTGFVKNIKGFSQKFMEKIGDFWCAKFGVKKELLFPKHFRLRNFWAQNNSSLKKKIV